MRYDTAKFKTITISEEVALLMAMTADPIITPVMAAPASSATACHSSLLSEGTAETLLVVSSFIFCCHDSPQLPCRWCCDYVYSD